MAVPKPAPQPHPAHVRVLPGGVVTLPPEVVRAAGFEDGVELQVNVDQGELRLVPIQGEERELSPGLRGLYEYFAPVREEVLESGISEEELHDLIDEAIAASRRARPLPRE